MAFIAAIHNLRRKFTVAAERSRYFQDKHSCACGAPRRMKMILQSAGTLQHSWALDPASEKPGYWCFNLLHLHYLL